jgi:DNA primase
VATLPDGVDPDEFARKGGQEALEGLFARAKPAIEHLIDRALSELGPTATVEERVRAVEAVREVVLAAPDGLSRELYVASIAERLRVSVGAVQAILYEPARDERGPRHGGGAGLSEAGADASFGPPPGELAPFAPVEPPPFAPGVSPSVERDVRDDAFGLPPAGAPRKGFRKDFPRKGAAPTEPVRVPVKWQAPPVSMSEAGVVLSLLAYPVALAPVVAQDGALGEFASQELRALAEAVVAAVQEGVEVSPAASVGAVQDPRLRRLLEDGLAGNDAGLDQTAQHLLRLLDKVRLESRKRRARAAYAHGGAASPADEAAQRAFEEEQRRLLEESRELHRRIRERETRR